MKPQATNVGRIGLVLLLAVGLAACSDGEEALGGDGLPVKNPSETYGNASAPLAGEVTLESTGCWTVDVGGGAALMVFPEGWDKDESGAEMVSPDGQVGIADGDSVEGVGGSVDAAAFPGVPDGYWGNYLSFCNPQVQQFVVFDEVTSAG